jgi:hypothetical protein
MVISTDSIEPYPVPVSEQGRYGTVLTATVYSVLAPFSGPLVKLVHSAQNAEKITTLILDHVPGVVQSELQRTGSVAHWHPFRNYVAWCKICNTVGMFSKVRISETFIAGSILVKKSWVK